MILFHSDVGKGNDKRANRGAKRGPRFSQVFAIMCFAMQMFGNIIHAKEQILVSNATLVLRDNKTIPKPSKKNGHDNNCYDGIVYSDSGDQLMVWDRKVNIRIYDISTGKLILKNVYTYAKNDEWLWHPKGININKTKKECEWYPTLSFYHDLICTTYDPPKEFSQLRSFLNKCRHITPYASEIVKKGCKALKVLEPTVYALAYDNRQRLTPVIHDYNWPPRNRSSNTREPAFLYWLKGESLDMKTLAYVCEPADGTTCSPLASQKIAFYRNLKLWKMYSISDLLTKAGEKRISSFSLSPQGNLVCFVMYRPLDGSRIIGSLEWFMSYFKSYRVHIVIVVLDIQNDRILLKEKIVGIIGIEDKIVWRAAFFESRREFVLLNAKTGEIKMYRY